MTSSCMPHEFKCMELTDCPDDWWRRQVRLEFSASHYVKQIRPRILVKCNFFVCIHSFLCPWFVKCSKTWSCARSKHWLKTENRHCSLSSVNFVCSFTDTVTTKVFILEHLHNGFARTALRRWLESTAALNCHAMASLSFVPTLFRVARGTIVARLAF